MPGGKSAFDPRMSLDLDAIDHLNSNQRQPVPQFFLKSVRKDISEKTQIGGEAFKASQKNSVKDAREKHGPEIPQIAKAVRN